MASREANTHSLKAQVGANVESGRAAKTQPYAHASAQAKRRSDRVASREASTHKLKAQVGTNVQSGRAAKTQPYAHASA